MRKVWPGTLMLAGVLLAACSPVATPTLSPGTGGSTTEIVEPMQIDDVQVVGLDSAPPQPAVSVGGVIGDSCNALDSVTQTRDGNTISIQINVRRTIDPAVPCAELAQLYSETLPLEGDFAPGEYTLIVNGSAITFTIEPPGTSTPTPTPECTYDATFIEDVTLPAGSPMAGGEPFAKTWRVRNTGTCAWDSNFGLVIVEGDTITLEPPGTQSVPLPATSPGEESEVTAELTMSPAVALGSEQEALLQMITPDGQLFGETLRVQVTAAESSSSVPLSSLGCTLRSEFVEDVTIPDGSPMAAGQSFVKTWRIRNSGTCIWDSTYEFVQIRGETILPTRGPDPIPLPELTPDGVLNVRPGDEVDITLELVMSPEVPAGSEQEARFQLRAPNGVLFGTQPFVLVTVTER